jgi:type II secretory pathway predicted ATPase ExeA
MYLEHFGLKHPPFRITPDQDFFFPGADRGAVLDALVYAVAKGEGIVKITGEVGTGKTMLCRALVSRLPENIDLIYLPNPSLPRHEILYAIADELGLTHLADSKSTQVLREIQNHLIAKLAQGRQAVLIIDEAQATPLDTLEEIRLLSNLETGTSKLLQIVLFGQPELDLHLNQPHIRQLKERITHSFFLQPFTRKEIDDYLAHRMNTAGFCGPSIFSGGAIGLLHKASQGLIRRVNIFADKALLAAFSEGAFNISRRHIKAAVRDSSSGSTQRPLSPFKWLALAALLSLGVLAAALWFVQGRPHGAPQAETRPLTAAPSAAPVAPEAAKPAPAAVQEGAPAVATREADDAPALRQSEELLPAPLANAGTDSPQALPAAQTAPTTQAAFTEWLNGQNSAHFTLQLMGVPPEAAEIELQRIRAQSGLDPNQLFFYVTRAGGKPVANIISGSYPTLKEAMKEIAKLPPSFQQNQPLIRTFKGIRDEIGK